MTCLTDALAATGAANGTDPTCAAGLPAALLYGDRIAAALIPN